MAKWMDVGAQEEFPAGAKKCLHAGELPLVVCNLEGELAAVLNICPHAGLPLGEGDLQNGILTCPFHGYAYDVKTGRNIDYADDIPVGTYPVRCTAAGRVEVDLEPEPAPS